MASTCEQIVNLVRCWVGVCALQADVIGFRWNNLGGIVDDIWAWKQDFNHDKYTSTMYFIFCLNWMHILLLLFQQKCYMENIAIKSVRISRVRMTLVIYIILLVIIPTVVKLSHPISLQAAIL